MAEKLEERPVGKSKPAWEHIAMYIKEKGWTGGRWGAVGMSAMESFRPAAGSCKHGKGWEIF